eukprot:1254993-Rhodomonas_salina.4
MEKRGVLRVVPGGGVLDRTEWMCIAEWMCSTEAGVWGYCRSFAYCWPHLGTPLTPQVQTVRQKWFSDLISPPTGHGCLGFLLRPQTRPGSAQINDKKTLFGTSCTRNAAKSNTNKPALLVQTVRRSRVLVFDSAVWCPNTALRPYSRSMVLRPPYYNFVRATCIRRTNNTVLTARTSLPVRPDRVLSV